MNVLYENLTKREIERREFEAMLHGAEIKKDSSSIPEKSERKEKKNLFMFGDPEEYKKMSDKERKELTMKMMGVHKSWASSKPLGGKTRHTPKVVGG